MNRLDPAGLWAFYVTCTGMFGGGWGFVAQGGIVIDDEGNVGYITISAEGVCTPQGMVGVSFGYSWQADTIFDLAGKGWASGASFGAFGFEGFVGDNDIGGYEFTIGKSLLPIPEGHFMRTDTIVTPTDLNWIEAKDMLLERLENAMYEVETVGEGYGWRLMYGIVN